MMAVCFTIGGAHLEATATEAWGQFFLSTTLCECPPLSERGVSGHVPSNAGPRPLKTAREGLPQLARVRTLSSENNLVFCSGGCHFPSADALHLPATRRAHAAASRAKRRGDTRGQPWQPGSTCRKENRNWPLQRWHTERLHDEGASL